MIAVDTSVWVAALRRRESPEARELSLLLDRDEVGLTAPVRVELLAGARQRDRGRLRRLLSALPVLYPAEGTWARIDAWIDRAGAAGERFGFADLLIGALASERNARVWSLDSDFARMHRLGLIDLYRP
jgi:predicted nucleic acid-binding protein